MGDLLGKYSRIVYYVAIVAAIGYGVVKLIWMDDTAKHDAGSNFSLIIAYILGGIAILATVVASVVAIMYNPKSALRFVIGIALLAIIGFIGYSISGGEVTKKYVKLGLTEASESKMVDAGLYLFYGTVTAAIIGIIVSEVKGLIKG